MTMQEHSSTTNFNQRRQYRTPIVTTVNKKVCKSTNNNNTNGRTVRLRFIVPLGVLSHVLVGVVTFHLGLTIGVGRRLSETSSNHTIFPQSISGMFLGASTVRRDNFIQEYDVGVPWNEPKPGATDVLLLYGSESSLPTNYYDNKFRGNLDTTDSKRSPIRASYNSAVDATVNCHTMKVILTEPNTQNECIAIVPQWESFHVQNFMRIIPGKNKTKGQPHFSRAYPLRLVSRKDTLSGKSTAQIPMAYQSKKYWPMLIDYLEKLPSTLERLKPIAEHVATASQGKAIVVMVCNFGQSELLLNFICSATARGLDLSSVLLFATDNDTSLLAKSFGITVFDVYDAFGTMPTGAAKVYGDRTFKDMMMSKVYCVHLVNALGYDVLFQDVDVVWYRNPIDFFHSPQSGNFDFYFQDGTSNSVIVDPIVEATFH
jgi:Nucleotide-diphospho-sugar transferase